MLRHVVMFRWNDDVAPGHTAVVAAGLDALPAEIEVIRSFRHGADLGAVAGNFDYALVAEFDSVDDFLTYRNHPVHQAFVAANIATQAKDRAAVQYVID
jgi:hypothetical protein